MRRLRGDAGVAGILLLSLAVVLALVAGLTASLSAVAVARQRAASVADMAALAAASVALAGPAVACARAGKLALDSGATVSDCRLVGEVADVVAQVRPAGPLGRWGVASARSRAGPVQ